MNKKEPNIIKFETVLAREREIYKKRYARLGDKFTDHDFDGPGSGDVPDAIRDKIGCTERVGP